MGMDVGAASGKKGRNTPEMNVTPLVDVVLVLLIIFMVVTPMMAKMFWINLPDKPKDEVVAGQNEPPLVVSVTSDGSLRLNKEVVPEKEFSNRLRSALAAKGSRTIFFDAHDDAPFERAVTAMDLSRAGGAAHIAVSTEALQGVP